MLSDSIFTPVVISISTPVEMRSPVWTDPVRSDTGAVVREHPVILIAIRLMAATLIIVRVEVIGISLQYNKNLTYDALM